MNPGLNEARGVVSPGGRWPDHPSHTPPCAFEIQFHPTSISNRGSCGGTALIDCETPPRKLRHSSDPTNGSLSLERWLR